MSSGVAANPAVRSRSLRLDGLHLDIRDAVAVREQALQQGVLLYLSLYEDEIDARCERFVEGLNETPAWRAEHLELTDAAVIHCRDGGLYVIRGSACTFPLYWQGGSGTIRLSTSLPLLQGPRFSRNGLLAAMAAVSLPGSRELNTCLETPLLDWQRIRRGAVTRFAGTILTGETQIDHLEDIPAGNEPPDVARQVRDAFIAYSRSQHAVRTSAVELSGGYDSTLAAAAALGPHHRMHGVSVEFPYYEFRFETDVQQAVAAALGIPRTVLDGTQLYPYAPWEVPPRFDEPALFVTGIRHAEVVARFAAERGATRLYTGHGGDHLFAMDLTALETVTPHLDRHAFTKEARRTLSGVLASLEEPAWRRRTTGCFVYDARQDVWVKEAFGLTLRTPFTDLAIFRSGIAWSKLNAARHTRPEKSILEQAVGHLLPEAVTQRKGKVAYDGVWMRAYASHYTHIAHVLDRAAGVLEWIGLQPAWLLQQARALADWRPASQHEILGAYAIATWLVSWGFERVQDMAWE